MQIFEHIPIYSLDTLPHWGLIFLYMLASPL
uniref:Uncharacterized protein n=1 Tax=virus sp. ctkyY8 TaxID=2827995 RepID=A0A8S5RDR8_9VIRU|nr:MAG TPA: hypothetical protein [virus sp. ctkyY8]